MPAPTVLMGAVAYDPKVVTIWEGFRAWLRGRGLDFDFVLYSHYERQVEDLVAGRIDVAWNSPLAWVRAERLAAATARPCARSPCATPTGTSPRSWWCAPTRRCTQVARPRGRVVAVGAVDSPQATLIPLRSPRGRPGSTVDVRRFDVGVGLHGDHIGGERDAARALVAGEVDAACMIDANHLRSSGRARCRPSGTRIVGADRRVRPLQHDGPRSRRPTGVAALRHAAARHVVRRPAGASAARPGGADGLAGRAAPPATRPRRGGRRQRLLRPRRAGDGHGLPAVSAAPASPRSTSGPGLRPGRAPAGAARAGRLPPGGRLAVSGRDPALRVHLPRLVPWPGPRVEWPDRGERSDLVAVVVRGAADDDRWSGAERAGPALPSALAAARRRGGGSAPAARCSKPVARRPGSTWTTATWCGPTSPRTCTRRRPPRSGTRQTAVPWDDAVRAAGRRRGRGRAGDDLPGRERAGRARRAGPVPRADPPALPGGGAAARRAGGRRGPAHRGVHPAGAAAGRRAGHVVGRRPAVAAARSSTSPTSRSPRSCSPCSARAASSTCSSFLHEHAPDPVTAADLLARHAGRAPARGVRHGAPGASGAARPAAAGPAAGGDRAPPRRAASTPPASTRTSSTRWWCSRPAAGIRTPSSAGFDRVQALQARDGSRAVSAASSAWASRPTRPPRCPPCTPATSCSRPPRTAGVRGGRGHGRSASGGHWPSRVRIYARSRPP